MDEDDRFLATPIANIARLEHLVANECLQQVHGCVDGLRDNVVVTETTTTIQRSRRPRVPGLIA